MSDSTLREQEEAYRQLSPEELMVIYERARRDGKKRETDPKSEPWAWKEVTYVLALILLIGLLLIQFLA